MTLNRSLYDSPLEGSSWKALKFLNALATHMYMYSYMSIGGVKLIYDVYEARQERQGPVALQQNSLSMWRIVMNWRSSYL